MKTFSKLSVHPWIFFFPFLVPESGYILDKAYFCGTYFLRICGPPLETRLQQIKEIINDYPVSLSQPFVNGSFSIPANVSDLENPQFEIIFLSPWSNYYIDIYLEDPKGRIYVLHTGLANITKIWSDAVYSITPELLTFEPGDWFFALQRQSPNSPDIGQKLYISAYVDTGKKPYGSGFLQNFAKSGGMNATNLFAASIFAEVNAVDDWDLGKNVSVTAVIAKNEMSSPVELTMLDDGLITPDLMMGDDIFSNYFYDIYYRGFYSVKYRMESSFDESLNRMWPGPSFYVEEPLSQSSQDRIPPSRITDFRIKTYNDPNKRGAVSLLFTAPGDNWNDGEGISQKKDLLTHEELIAEAE